jgi:hypothetical protein
MREMTTVQAVDHHAAKLLALHGGCDDLLTFTAAPISRQPTRPYSRSMTDEAPPPQRGAELASQAGLRASHVDRTGPSSCCGWRRVMAG